MIQDRQRANEKLRSHPDNPYKEAACQNENQNSALGTYVFSLIISTSETELAIWRAKINLDSESRCQKLAVVARQKLNFEVTNFLLGQQKSLSLILK